MAGERAAAGELQFGGGVGSPPDHLVEAEPRQHRVLAFAEVEREVAVRVGGVEGDGTDAVGGVHDVRRGLAGHLGGPPAAHADLAGDALGADGEGDVPQPVAQRAAVGGRGEVDGRLEAGTVVGEPPLVLVGARAGCRRVRDGQPELRLAVALAQHQLGGDVARLDAVEVAVPGEVQHGAAQIGAGDAMAHTELGRDVVAVVGDRACGVTEEGVAGEGPAGVDEHGSRHLGPRRLLLEPHQLQQLVEHPVTYEVKP